MNFRKSLKKRIGTSALIWPHPAKFAIWPCPRPELFWSGSKQSPLSSPWSACFWVNNLSFHTIWKNDYFSRHDFISQILTCLVLGLEQGLDHYCPTRFYIVTTLAYYVLTEKLIQDSLPNVLLLFPNKGLQDEICGLEKPASALIIKCLTITMNLGMLLTPLFSQSLHLPLHLNSVKILLVTLYFNVWLQYKSSLVIKSQVEGELALVSSFRVASPEELQSHDDVCAICLTSLEHARVTPCQHLFHSNCLRLCLKAASNLCPICKREFRFH